MKYMKKAMALLLCVIMTLAMSVSVFADGTATTVTLSIKDAVAGHTYKVYQLATGDVSGLSGGEGTLSNAEAGKNFKAGTTETDNSIDKVLVKLKATTTNSDLSKEAYQYIDTSTDAVAELSTTATSAKVAPGYYVIVDASYTGTDKENVVYSRNLVAVVGDTEVTPKTETPSIDKKIVDPEEDPNHAIDGNYSKTDTAAIGDVIEYEITGQVPNYAGYDYYYYIINDTLSEGLTLNPNSFIVKVNNNEITASAENGYYLYTGEQAGDKTFQIAFKNIEAFAAGQSISVYYTATVNEKAAIGTNPNTNTVYLQYSNNPNDSSKKDKSDKPGTPEPDKDGKTPTGETPKKVTKTYVTEVKLIKVDEEGNKLTGAEFQLTGKNLETIIVKTADVFTEDTQGNYYKLKDGSYTTEIPTQDTEITNPDGTKTEVKGTADKYESTTVKYTKTTKTETYAKTAGASENTNVKAFVNNDGILTFTGLHVGDYTISETTVPTGYNKVADITFTISASQTGAGADEGGNISWASSNTSVKLVEDSEGQSLGTFEVTVVNKKGDLLPSTGGIGTTIFYVVGTVLVLGAAVLLISKKRMSSEN